MVALSVALFLFGQAVCLSVLAWGCYLSLKNARLNDKESIERESCASSVLQPPAERYDPRADPKVAGEMGFSLYGNQRRRSS